MTDLLKKYLLNSVPHMADDAQVAELSVIDLEENLADAEKPPELPNGKYLAEVQGVEVKNSQQGNRYYAIKFMIPAEELPADVKDDYEDGAVMYWNRQLVPDKQDRRTLYNLRKFVESLGLDANTTRIDPNEWMGCRARLVVKQSAYQGEMRAQITAVEAAEGMVPQQATRGGRRQPEPEAETKPKRAASGGRRR